MRLSSFDITDEKHIVAVPAAEASPTWFEDGVHRWIDIEAPDDEELAAFLEPLQLDPAVLKAPAGSGFGFSGEIFDKLLLIRLPTQDPASEGGLTHISLLCLPTTLVTIHDQALPPISDLASRLTGRIRLKSATTSALVYQVVARLLVENFFAFTVCREKHDVLSRRMIEDSDSIEPEDLFALRREITNIGDANEDHAFCVDVLQKVESTSFAADDQSEHLKELERSLERHQRSMDRLEENVKDLHQQFLLSIQDKTGNRLKVLTILSAVFLPLTLIAGIYGMNFDHMPQLHWEYGYYMVWGIMAVLFIGMIVYFKRKHWL